MSCAYRTDNNCSFTGKSCPWVYWCGKIAGYKERDGINTYCKYIKQASIPVEYSSNGYYMVEFERKGYLYVTVNGQTLKILNPFDYIPKYVKVYQSKGIWKIKKEKEKKEK